MAVKLVTNKLPTRQEMDAAARQLARLEAAVKPTERQLKAKKLAGELRETMLGWAIAFGAVPESAPCSRRLQGSAYELTATTATLTTDHPEAVQELLEAMRAHNLETVFTQMYTPVTRYVRSPEAENNFRAASLTKKIRALLEPIFARTQSEKQRAPVLKISEVKKG